MGYLLGIDIGSVAIHGIVVGDAEDTSQFADVARNGRFCLSHPPPESPLVGRPLLVSAYQRIRGAPLEAVTRFLDVLRDGIPFDRVAATGLTGSGAQRVGELLSIPVENEFRALAHGLTALHPSVRTILEIGGAASKYMAVAVEPADGGLRILDYGRNSECAAGTGSFIDQQASRLRYDVEDVGALVLAAQRSAAIAGRCSVFAKTDMVHAQQRGFQPAEILKGLCETVISNFRDTVLKGKAIEPPVAFVGGLAANVGVAQALRTRLGLADGTFFVPPLHTACSALGAALLAGQQKARSSGLRLSEGAATLRNAAAAHHEFPRLPPLSLDLVTFLSERVRPCSLPDEPACVDVYLGVDIGSVSTNLAVVTAGGDVLHTIYTKTESRPVEAVSRGLREIKAVLGQRIRVRGVGTTGSGRELGGVLIGADVVKDEITAHKTGAMHVGESLLGRMPDTIFEIGGQDSKFIALDEGTVVDFAMNEACAAGTGSFLEEQAEKLGIQIANEFSRLALSSSHPIRVGERCTVFMERDLVPFLHRGAKQEDLLAGLAYSIATNYINRVVRDRRIGRVIFFQGGTAYNASVAAAFATLLHQEIIVPPFNGELGAIGAALLARDHAATATRPTGFRGYDIPAADYALRHCTCKGCANACEIQEFSIRGEKTYWGDKCSDRYPRRATLGRRPVIPDLLSFRERIMTEVCEAPASSGARIGIPRSMYFYDQFPFWHAYLTGLGAQVVLSEKTNRAVVEAGLRATVAEPCFPLIVAHGHVANLIEQGVDFVFQPNIMNGETLFPETESYVCPWGLTLPFVLMAAPAFEAFAARFLRPTVHFRDGVEVVQRDLRPMAKGLGASSRLSDQAVAAAYEAQRGFAGQLAAAGQTALDALQAHQAQAVVLLGRPYNLYDRGVNLDVPAKLARNYGINVIPMDFLRLDGVDIRDINGNMFWNYGRRILQAAKLAGTRPDLHIIYVTNFKCGPDSYIKHYIRKASGKPHLNLQFDGHSNDAGVMTRCEAYLDSRGFLK